MQGGVKLSATPQLPRLPRQYPLVLRWSELPVRRILPLSCMAPDRLHEAPPWFDSGPPAQPFDFCGRIRRLLDDIVSRCPELAHVHVSRILVGVTRARSTRVRGLQARVAALRFADGGLTRQQRGVTYQVQRYFVGSHEFLYLLTFCLPRFLDQDFGEKLITLMHELYHISPACDGYLRQHAGRYQLHTHSKCAYDRRMADLARAYLATKPDPALFAFLRLNFAQLQQRHASILGVVVPRPMIVPVLGQAAQIAGEDP
jgi:hypothetical protein